MFGRETLTKELNGIPPPRPKEGSQRRTSKDRPGALLKLQRERWDHVIIHRVRTPQGGFFSKIFQEVFTHNFQYISGLF
jgi:hypothetical protein